MKKDKSTVQKVPSNEKPAAKNGSSSRKRFTHLYPTTPGFTQSETDFYADSVVNCSQASFMTDKSGPSAPKCQKLGGGNVAAGGDENPYGSVQGNSQASQRSDISENWVKNTQLETKSILKGMSRALHDISILKEYAIKEANPNMDTLLDKLVTIVNDLNSKVTEDVIAALKDAFAELKDDELKNELRTALGSITNSIDSKTSKIDSITSKIDSIARKNDRHFEELYNKQTELVDQIEKIENRMVIDKNEAMERINTIVSTMQDLITVEKTNKFSGSQQPSVIYHKDFSSNDWMNGSGQDSVENSGFDWFL